LKAKWLLWLFLSTATPLVAQSQPSVIYAESFRQGNTRIIEEKFETKLTPQDRTYTERIRDSHGNDRYILSIFPHTPEGDTSITYWRVKLSDLNHRIYDNLLLASLQEDAIDNLKNELGILNPSNFARVPAKIERIIKVENFYVVLQIKSFHFTPIESPYLDSMTVAVNLTNTDPRSATDAAK
jgi:hypothetical protein